LALILAIHAFYRLHSDPEQKGHKTGIVSYLLAVYVDIELCPHKMERSGEPISAVAAHGRPLKYYSGERYREAAPQQRLAGDAATATLMEAISYCS